MVRAVIQLNENFNLDQFNRWQTTTDGVPYPLTKRSRFADPRPLFGGLWNYRSTFYKKVNEGRWYIAEIGNKFMDNDEPFGTTPEISGDLDDVDILTVLSKGDEPMDYFGRIMDEGGVEVVAMDDEDDGFFGVVQLQPGGDLQPGQNLQPGEVQAILAQGSSSQAPPSLAFASPVATFTDRGRRPWHRYGTWPQRFCNGDRPFSTGWCQPLPNSQARAARPSPTLHWCVQGPRPHTTRQGGAHAPCVGAGSYSDVVAA